MVDIVFLDIGIIIIMAAVAAFFAGKFKQPLIPAYIFAGLLIGPVFEIFTGIDWFNQLLHLPAGFRIITDQNLIRTLSEIGIAFLLFMVGLEIDLKKLKDIEKVAAIGGFLQVAILFLIGLLIAYFMLYTPIEAVYIGLVVAFSSTMVIIKVLSDRKELDTLHGRIAIGILIVQDIIAIFALIVLGSLGEHLLLRLSGSLFGGAALFLVAFFLSKFVFSGMFRFAAHSRELFFLLSISICFMFALFFNRLGYSIAIGAFVAGVSLGNLPYNFEIIGKVKSLRDFFATMFFVSLGLQLPLDNVLQLLLPLVVLMLAVLIIKPLIFMILIGLFGYKKRTSFLTSLSLAQISEFSLILIAQGMLLGHISEQIFTVTILLAIATISLSSYFLKFEYKIYSWLSPELSIFERQRTQEDALEFVPKEKHEVVLIGYDRTGYSVFHRLLKQKRKFLVIDYNPEIIKKLIKAKIPCIYGDAGSHEILDKIDFKSIKYLISTIPDHQTSLFIVKKAKRANEKVVIFVTTYQVDDALSLYDLGADYVILPHFLGGHHASVLLEEASKDITKLIKRKIKHIKELNHRKNLGHEHPRQHHHFPKPH